MESEEPEVVEVSTTDEVPTADEVAESSATDESTEEVVSAPVVSDPVTQTFEITAYTARCDGCSGITASGYDVQSTVYSPEGLRIVAAPASIPFGTVLRISLDNGNTFDAVVLDRGGDITEGRLDFLVDTYDEAMAFGRQSVKVEILSEG